MLFGLSRIVFKAVLILAISFVGIAIFRILEERARRLQNAAALWGSVFLCNVGKALSVILAVALVLWRQVVQILEYL